MQPSISTIEAKSGLHERMDALLGRLRAAGVVFAPPGEAMRRAVAEAEEARTACLIRKTRVPQYFRSAEIAPGSLGEYLRNRLSSGLSAYVYGPPGAGKTYAACAAALDLASHLREVLFVDAADLMDSSSGAEGCVPMARIESAPILVVDDIDKLPFENGFGRWCELAFRLADRRQGKPTLWTANCDAEGLRRLVAAASQPSRALAVKRRIQGQCKHEIEAARGGWRVTGGAS